MKQLLAGGLIGALGWMIVTRVVEVMGIEGMLEALHLGEDS